MFNEKNLKKINLIIGILSIIVFVFGFFDIQFRGAVIVNKMPNIEIAILAPLKNVIVELVGNDYGQLFNNILCFNIVWYLIVVWPVWCWTFVRRCLKVD